MADADTSAADSKSHRSQQEAGVEDEPRTARCIEVTTIDGDEDGLGLDNVVVEPVEDDSSTMAGTAVNNPMHVAATGVRPVVPPLSGAAGGPASVFSAQTARSPHAPNGASLRVWVATWNVGNKPPPANLAPWLPTGGEYDIIVVGCQEGTFKVKTSGHAGGGEGDASAATGLLAEDADSDEEDVHVVESPDDVLSPAGAAAMVRPPHPASGETGGSAVPLDKPTKGQVATAAMRGVAGFIDARNTAAEKHAAEASSPATARKSIAATQGRTPRGVTDLAAQAKNQAYESRHCPFFDAVTAFLGDRYTLVQSLLMWQIGLLVFVRNLHAPHVSAVEDGTEATGILGVAGNKGGVAIKFNVYGLSFVFINSHLAAHMKHVDKRNSDTAEILNNMRLGSWHIDIDTQFNHTFWMGDLNYRVDMGITDPAIKRGEESRELATALKERIESGGEFLSLLASDQLRDAQATGKALTGFSEGEITFAPTFKVARAAGLSYTTARTPSWCDRILFKSQPGYNTDVRCTSYSSHPSVATSDHKPVSASFDVSIPAPLVPVSRSVHTPAPYARITNLRAKDLFASDFSQSSDPYVMFYSFPPALLSIGKHQPRTTWKRQTLAPVWDKPGDIPGELLLTFAQPRDYTRAALVLVLMDKDIDHDDRLGQAVLPLSDAAISNRPEPFELPVIRGGTRWGTIAGTIEIVWPGPRRASAPITRMSPFARSGLEDKPATCECSCSVM